VIVVGPSRNLEMVTAYLQRQARKVLNGRVVGLHFRAPPACDRLVRRLSELGTNSPFAALQRFRQLLEVLLPCRRRSGQLNGECSRLDP
jgi:hypothetical protein